MNRHTETPSHLGKRIKPPYDQRFSDLLRTKVYEGLKKLKNDGKNPINYDEMFEEIEKVGEFGYLPEWQDYQEYWKKRLKKRRNKEEVFEEYIRDLINKGWIQGKILGLTGYFSGLIERILKETSD